MTDPTPARLKEYAEWLEGLQVPRSGDELRACADRWELQLELLQQAGDSLAHYRERAEQAEDLLAEERARHAEKDREQAQIALKALERAEKAEARAEEFAQRANYAETELSTAFELPRAYGPSKGEAARILWELRERAEKAEADLKRHRQAIERIGEDVLPEPVSYANITPEMVRDAAIKVVARVRELDVELRGTRRRLMLALRAGVMPARQESEIQRAGADREREAARDRVREAEALAAKRLQMLTVQSEALLAAGVRTRELEAQLNEERACHDCDEYRAALGKKLVAEVALADRLAEALNATTGGAAEAAANDLDHDNRYHSKWYRAVKKGRKELAVWKEARTGRFLARWPTSSRPRGRRSRVAEQDEREIAKWRERDRIREELMRQDRYAEAADHRYDNLGRDMDAAYLDWSSRG